MSAEQLRRHLAGKPRLAELAALLTPDGENGLPLDERVRLAAHLRTESPEAGLLLDRHLFEENASMRQGLEQMRGHLEEAKQLVEQVLSPPYFPAVLLGLEETQRGPAALVVCGTQRRAVCLGPEIDMARMRPGDEVLLNEKLNLVVAHSPYRMMTTGETATFERSLPDGRIVLRSRDEEVLAFVSASLDGAALRKGDYVRFDRAACLALERVERSAGEEYCLEDRPRETFADVGGLDDEIELLQRAIRMRRFHSGQAALYGLPMLKSILLYGPPGTGKTLMARALANWLAELSGTQRSFFMAVKPSGLGSMWYSQTEANIRSIFAAARAAGSRSPDIPLVMFWDEVDSIAAQRGESPFRVHNDVTNAFLAELDGMEALGNVLVVAATNRLEDLDVGATRASRLGDLKLKIPRPRRTSASEIFQRHLEAGIPYAGHGSPIQRRASIIEGAVSALYAPNGDNRVATLTFRDGKTRTVLARDLISGAEIARIARSAKERACVRHIECGEEGLCLEDLLAGVEEFCESAAALLTPANCRRHLEDLPQDIDVVKVERERRVARAPARFRAA
jgi:proteasome-associated ATPase